MLLPRGRGRAEAGSGEGRSPWVSGRGQTVDVGTDAELDFGGGEPESGFCGGVAVGLEGLLRANVGGEEQQGLGGSWAENGAVDD